MRNMRGEMEAREAPHLGQVLGGLLQMLLLLGIAAGLAGALLRLGGWPGPPPAWPSWGDVLEALTSRSGQAPTGAVMWSLHIAGWAALGYLLLTMGLQALVRALVGVTRGAAWALDLARLIDLVTLPWVRRAVEGGLMAAILLATVGVQRPSLELPRPGGDGHLGERPAPQWGAEARRLLTEAPSRRETDQGPAAAVTMTAQEAPIERAEAASHPAAAESGQPVLPPADGAAAAPSAPTPGSTVERPTLPPPAAPGDASGSGGQEQPRRAVQPGVRQAAPTAAEDTALPPPA